MREKKPDAFYYVNKERNPQGPFSAEQLRRLAGDGVIRGGTLVIREGEAEYQKWDDLNFVLLAEAGEARRAEQRRAREERLAAGNALDPLEERYRTAYFVANFIRVIGAMVMGLGVLAFATGLFAIAVFADNTNSAASPYGTLSFVALPFAIGAVVVGVVLVLIGTLLKAVGELLKVQIDTAINTSPLLDNAGRIKILRLH